MDSCRCGCGKPTTDGRDFLPGHDSKLRAKIEDEVGGLFSLQELVDGAKKYSCGTMESEKFTSLVRKIFATMAK